jgi:hypothetical protein
VATGPDAVQVSPKLHVYAVIAPTEVAASKLHTRPVQLVLNLANGEPGTLGIQDGDEVVYKPSS